MQAKLVIVFFANCVKCMSYDDTPPYERENFLNSRLDVLLDNLPVSNYTMTSTVNLVTWSLSHSVIASTSKARTHMATSHHPARRALTHNTQPGEPPERRPAS